MTIICTKDEWERLLPEGNTGSFTITLSTMLVKAPKPKRYDSAKPTDKLRFEIDIREGR